MTDKFLAYRGDIQAAAGQGTTVVFVTRHPEDQPSALYRLDAEQLTVEAESLPCGGLAILVSGPDVYLAGSDAVIYVRRAKDKKPKPLTESLSVAATGLAILSGDRLAALTGKTVTIVGRDDGKILQTLELAELGTALAADPTGTWLAAGTEKGQVSVFECEDKEQFLLSETEKLHDGAVTSLLFEPEELRFFSSGLDQKLLITHARGKLEPEDRGRGASHGDRVTAMMLGLEDRFYTGSRDGTVKNWARSGGQRPSTLSDGVAKVVDLALVEIHARPHLAVACEDNSLRLFLLDPSGKIGQIVHKVLDAYAAAEHEFSQADTSRRQAALKNLGRFDDARSLEMLAARAEQDTDSGLRLLAAETMGASQHARATGLLEKLLGHRDSAVRLAALDGLRSRLGQQDLRPLELALAVKQADVGCQALSALEQLAKKDDQALGMLKQALQQDPREVRQAALLSLESAFEKNSPEAELTGLESKHADLRGLALVRLLHRKLIDRADVQAALRRASEDKNAVVRQTAFLVSLFTRPKLVDALRARDATLHRLLHELETFDPNRSSPPKEPPKPRVGKLSLAPADFEPLLQAMANRSLDTCLFGGRCLALLGDARAFGLLLQLSREDDAGARVEVCQAFSALGDPRSAERLSTLLHDEAAEVRDAAFSALAHIYQKQPLRAAEFGLNASFEDVRRRGLQLLIREVRKSPPQQPAEPGWDLLLRALNDSFDSVRSEAFKACVNTQVAGGGVATLRFVLNSVHDDIRREVLTETMGQHSADWAPALLLEFFNDPSAELREESFEFVRKKSKGKDLGHLEAAAASRYPDRRLAAVLQLAKRHTAAAQKLLVAAINDTDLQVRQSALQAVLDDAGKEVLAQALSSQHIDVRLRAATARAWHGDPAALDPLLAMATEEEPEEEHLKGVWGKLVPQALEGLGILGDGAAFAPVLTLTESKHGQIRVAAATALLGMAQAEHAPALRALLQHDDKAVKYRAALALAWCGDDTAAPLVFSEEAGKFLTGRQQLAAAVTLGPGGEDQLINALDHPQAELRRTALLLLLLEELVDHDGVPRRCLACLSARAPRMRLAGARALRHFGDRAALLRYVTETLNDRDTDPAWTTPERTVETLAVGLTFAPLTVKARIVQLLQYATTEASATTEKSSEQDAWNLHWEVFARRFAKPLEAARQQAESSPPAESSFTPEQLGELTFGAYIGLLREQPAYEGRDRRRAAEVARVRQTAISRLVAMAEEGEVYHTAALPVLVQALGDPNQAVRFQAFESLQKLKLDPARLGSEALQSGHTDLGVAGLKLLTEGASAKAGREILQQAMLTREDDLATEAAKLLAVSHGVVKIASQALEARYDRLKYRALEWLSEQYEQDPAAPGALRQALESRYRQVRRHAAILLAYKKDAAALDALRELLGSEQKTEQRNALNAFEKLGDEHVPDVLLDRLENDPSGTAETRQALQIVGNYRRPEVSERLLKMMEQSKWRSDAFTALYTISGHDQSVEDPEDELPNPTWEEKQHARHDAVLAALLEKTLNLGMVAQALQILPEARWARGPEVAEPLTIAAQHPDDNLRREAVWAIGWRLKKRAGSAEPLLKALEHKDGTTKFLAAEGLARGGRAEGIEVLLAAVDLLSELDLRRRAVFALGELGDARALDLLLKLASDHEHALQDVAAEAIGHLGKSPKADDIFKLLKQLAEGGGRAASIEALRGLRWFNTNDAWQLIRTSFETDSYHTACVALELLGYNDAPETRDLLLHTIATQEEGYAQVALIAARRIFGTESLQPDYAWLKNDLLEDLVDPVVGCALQRVCERGEPAQMLALAPFRDDESQVQLGVALMRRTPLPLDAAEEALESNQPITVKLAAQLLSRMDTSPTKKQVRAIESACERWRTRWEQERARLLRENDEDQVDLDTITACLTMLLATAGGLGSSEKVLLDALAAWPADPCSVPLRVQAALALETSAGGKPSKAVVEALRSGILAESQPLRLAAASVLAQLPAKEVQPLPDELLSDRLTLTRLLAHGIDPPAQFEQALAEPNRQGVVLPWAVERQQVDQLAAVMEDPQAAESARLGAIEGLGRIPSPAAVQRLATFGADEKDEDLRKAAWKARRRSLRAGAKQSTDEPTTAATATKTPAAKAPVKKKTTRKKKK